MTPKRTIVIDYICETPGCKDPATHHWSVTTDSGWYSELSPSCSGCMCPMTGLLKVGE